MSNSSIVLSAAPARRAGGILIVLLASALWSTSGMFITLIARQGGISAIGIAFWRDLGTFAVLLVGILLLRPGLLRVARCDLPWLIAMGSVSIGFFHVLWNTSVLINGVAISTVLQANAPIIVTIVAWFLWREPLTWRKIGAIVLAILGTALIGRIDSVSQQQITLPGLLLALATAVIYGMMSLFGKKLAGDYNPLTILIYIFGFATLTLLPFQIGDSFTMPRSTPAVAYFAGLVLITTVGGFALYTLGLSRLQASVAAIIAMAEVPFATFVSYIALGERLSLWQIGGGLLIIGGVILLSWPRKRRPDRSAK